MPQPKFTPFPVLMTNRLVLRRLRLEDQHTIFNLHADAENRKYIDKAPAKSILESQDFIKKMNKGIDHNTWIYWIISLKSSLEAVGTICIWNFSKDYSKADIGYELAPNFQGRGIMNEALDTIVNYGFKVLKLQELEAYTHIDNQNSIRLLEKNNFTFKKKFEESYYSKSGKYWMVVYAINNE